MVGGLYIKPDVPVLYLPRLVYKPTFVFKVLWDMMPWEKREGAPRREAWFNPYDMPYTYGTGEYARTYAAHPLNDDGGVPAWIIGSIMQRLNDLGDSYDCCFVNGYENGRQHLGWHADDSPEMDTNHPIATVSLGAEREIWFRRKGDDTGAHVEKLLLKNGSAAIMSEHMQEEWQHRIPKSSVADCGPRLSLTYRKLVR